jgi:hypothetical protein
MSSAAAGAGWTAKILKLKTAAYANLRIDLMCDLLFLV